MNIEAKLEVLAQLYEIHATHTAPWETACRKGCAACCTCNVTLTTLEGWALIEHWKHAGIRPPLERLRALQDQRRFQPRATPNRIAALCVSGKALPEEENNPAWGACPLLARDLCSVYPARPLGCRCLLSERDCREGGFARVDPLLLTINTVLMQIVEHVDTPGWTGNLLDVLLFLDSEANRRTYRRAGEIESPRGLVRNWPLQQLMVPPEHRCAVTPLLRALDRRIWGGASGNLEQGDMRRAPPRDRFD